VRPLTDGTVTGGGLATESLPIFEAVLEAVLDAAGVVVGVAAGVEEAPTATPCTPWAEAVAAMAPSGEMPSTPAAGRVSLLAAQASEATRANERITLIDDDL
jgi:hypothetical protein